MRLTSLALLLVALGGPALAAPTAERAAAAHRVLDDLQVDLDGASLSDREAIATAVLLARRPERPLARHLRRAGRDAGALLFRVKVQDGVVEQITLVGDDVGDADLARRLARRLSRARAGRDIDAEVFVPVVVRP